LGYFCGVVTENYIINLLLNKVEKENLMVKD